VGTGDVHCLAQAWQRIVAVAEIGGPPADGDQQDALGGIERQ
jgi:hypothetical protein